MTLGAAWIRKGPSGEELWMASDSRLSGNGLVWDDCPKIVLLPRHDAVLAFSGSTAEAYPLILQMANSISSYRAAINGELEFYRMAAHLERVINSMMNRMKPDSLIRGTSNEPLPFSGTGDQILLGGYSREKGGMAIQNLKYEKGSAEWKIGKVIRNHEGRTFKSFGDSRSKSRFTYLIKELRREKKASGVLITDFEPLEVLAEMLRMESSSVAPLPVGFRPHTIGGAPQVVRIIGGAYATAYAVAWETDDGQDVYFQGRKVFDYERLDAPLIRMDEEGVNLVAPSQWAKLAHDDVETSTVEFNE